MKTSLASGLLVLLIFPAGAMAATDLPGITGEARPVKIYRSPEERREAGLGRRITDWLSVSGLAEIEMEHREDEFRSNISSVDGNEESQSLQLGFDITFNREITAELIFEYEVDQNFSALDEGMLTYEGDVWAFEAGRIYVPFGEYYSHFVSGPMLEFGETRGTGIVVDYALNDSIDVSIFGIDGEARKIGADNEIDWGIGLEIASGDESIKLGASYFSDLADTEERLLQDSNDRFRHRVGGWNAHALFGRDTYEITAEFVAAARGFAELERNGDRPWAANLEVAWFPWHRFQFALRLEASDEFEDQPERQAGASVTWVIGNHMTLAVDYLYGEFKDDFVFDDDENELDSRSQFAAQLALEF